MLKIRMAFKVINDNKKLVHFPGEPDTMVNHRKRIATNLPVNQKAHDSHSIFLVKLVLHLINSADPARQVQMAYLETKIMLPRYNFGGIQPSGLQLHPIV